MSSVLQQDNSLHFCTKFKYKIPDSALKWKLHVSFIFVTIIINLIYKMATWTWNKINKNVWCQFICEDIKKNLQLF